MKLLYGQAYYKPPRNSVVSRDACVHGAKGPFKQFQHLLQHAFNILLNQMSGASEEVIQHC